MFSADGSITHMVFFAHETIVDRFWLFDNEGIKGSFPSVIGQLANLSELSRYFPRHKYCLVIKLLIHHP